MKRIPAAVIACLLVFFCNLSTVFAADCPAGTFSPTVNAGDDAQGCTHCTNGKWSLARSFGANVEEGCAICNVGYGGDTCIACTSGKFSSSSIDKSECVDCDTNASTTCGLGNGGTNNSVAGSCDPGFYGIAKTDGDGTGCIACTAGKYKAGAGDSSDGSLCLVPGAGKCASSTGTSCSTQTGATTTFTCASGTYNADSSNPVTTCEPCADDSSCVAPSTPGICSAGYGGDADTQNGGAGCTVCSSGKYKDTAGNVGCINCPAGSYCPDAVTPPTQCTKGTKSSSDQASCDACANGKYSGDNATSCTPCTAGKYHTQIRALVL